MFKFLKDKLKDWTSKISKSEEAIEAKPRKKKAEKKEKPQKKKKIKENIEKNVISEPEIDVSQKDVPKNFDEEENQPGTESFFKKITSRLSKVKISEKEFDVYSDELRTLLLENNVAFEVAEKMVQRLREKVVNQEFLKKEVEGQIKYSLRDIIEEILIEPFDIPGRIELKNKSEKEPFVILFCGINGSGKTTSVAKVAEYLKRKKISVVLAAADTFRAASIEQLKKHGERIGVNVIAHDYGSDPASVGFDAIKYAKKNSIDCVLIDTAGRMHTAKNLLREMEKIVRVCKPDVKIFVGESITGNDAVEQAKAFNEAIGIDGVILTKSDIDEKGGTALSIGFVTGKPILFLGTGQEYENMEPFSKKKFVENLGL
ncbi:MAG: signal recognition particle-docking protein FtsY [Nanoarchaeota archaeon]